jgi:hypothetical protein
MASTGLLPMLRLAAVWPLAVVQPGDGPPTGPNLLRNGRFFTPGILGRDASSKFTR